MKGSEREIATKIGYVVQGSRKLLAYTQNDIADLFGIAQSTMSRIEKGLLVPDAPLMSRLIQFLRIDPILMHSLLLGERTDLQVLFQCYRKNKVMWKESNKRTFCSASRMGKKYGETLWEAREEYQKMQVEEKNKREAKEIN